MGYQDRPYYRDRSSGGSPLMWLLSGSVELFTFRGIHVRAHASLIITIVLVLLLAGFDWPDRVESMTALFVIVLLHEFGHCFAARAVGGDANEIMMTPLGGLAMADAPRRWKPTLITVLAGPAVNVAICLLCGVIIYAEFRTLPWSPIQLEPIYAFHGWTSILGWTIWIYQISYMLLIFNLLPVFPLDGGQALQAILWKFIGYYKSMNIACVVGLIGSSLMGMVAIANHVNLFLLLIAVSCFLTCLNMRRMLIAEGPWAFSDADDYDAGFHSTPTKPSRSMKRKRAAIEKIRQAEASEREQIDSILAKVSATGMQSLSFQEKRALKKATENQRKRDADLAELRRG